MAPMVAAMISPLLAIDPGESNGWALFEHGELVDYGTHDPEQTCNVLVIERPEIYRGSRANPNSILTLAINAGYWSGRIGHDRLVWYNPKQWKGQIPKTAKLDNYIIYKRVKRAYADVNLTGYTKKEAFDVVDAIGLGMFALKDLNAQ